MLAVIAAARPHATDTDNPWGLLPNMGIIPRVTLCSRKPLPPGFFYPCPASILTGTDPGKGLSAITNMQDLLGAPSLGEVPGWDCKV